MGWWRGRRPSSSLPLSPSPPFWCNPCTQKTEAASPPPSSTHSHFCGAPLPFSGEWLEGRGGGKKGGGGGGGAGRHPNSTFKGRGDLERRRRVSEGQKNVLEGGSESDVLLPLLLKRRRVEERGLHYLVPPSPTIKKKSIFCSSPSSTFLYRT